MLHAVVFIVAEKQGFEPWRPVTSLRAFQARPFDRLGTSPQMAIWASEIIVASVGRDNEKITILSRPGLVGVF